MIADTPCFVKCIFPIEIEGKDGKVSAKDFLSVLNSTLAILEGIDRAMSPDGEPQIEWIISSIRDEP